MQGKAKYAKSHLQFGELLSQGHYSVCMYVPAYVHMFVRLPCKYNNAAIFSHNRCSKSIKDLTEVPIGLQ